MLALEGGFPSALRRGAAELPEPTPVQEMCSLTSLSTGAAPSRCAQQQPKAGVSATSSTSRLLPRVHAVDQQSQEPARFGTNR